MTRKKNWVDYKEIKQKISLEMVLTHYGIFDDFKPSGKNLVACCPIHKGSNPRQFSVNMERNLWNCFGNCKTGGNVIDFVAMIEFGNTDEETIRKAGILLTKKFLTGCENSSVTRKNLALKTSKPVRISKEETNKPLKFKLKYPVRNHPFFEERNIEPETIHHFELGFCSKGIMKDRIAIPVHNEFGQLVAYCGRAISPEQIESKGKYRLPDKFYKSAVVYNLHRQPQDQKILILVESYLSVWKAYQAGIKNVVALMGSTLTEHQEELIVNHFSKTSGVILLFDDDDDGRKCTDDCLVRLGKKLFVKAVDISPYGKKPHHLSPEILKQLLG